MRGGNLSNAVQALMPLPEAPKVHVTFDVYGTLIDWEEGIYQAFSREAERTDSRSTATC